jgi:tyrosinase
VYKRQPFLFFVNQNGESVTGKAENYFSTNSFDYDYGPGFNKQRALSTKSVPANAYMAKPVQGVTRINLPKSILQSHLENTLPGMLIAEITVERPSDGNARQFDVLLNAPNSVQHADASSPYYVGTIAFFGPPMSHHAGMSHISTFILPLHLGLPAMKKLKGKPNAQLQLRVLPAGGKKGTAIVVREVNIRVAG